MTATVLINNEDCTGEYTMFDLRSLDEDGAVLGGPLFLEVGETLVLRVEKDDESINLVAKVHAIGADDATMTVRFVDRDPKLAAFVAAK
ncbi:MAG: hypothetical protein GY811_13875 [Myxococcales bacterium]|nr:hypothetical protein [Myxococcales bacterium]